MNKYSYAVTKDGVDCRLALRPELGLGSALCPKKGLLVPSNDITDVAVYYGEKSAQRAINRVCKVANRLRGTLVEGLPRLKPIMTPGKYALRKFVQ
jgi:hypothetical protein